VGRLREQPTHLRDPVANTTGAEAVYLNTE